jgi:hypothetical protein
MGIAEQLDDELRELYWQEPLQQYKDGAMLLEMVLAVVDRLAAGTYTDD